MNIAFPARAMDLPAAEPIIRAELAPFHPQLIYVFGSRVTGAIHPGSDLDIALLCARPCDPMALFEAAGQLASVLHTEVDLVDLAGASTVMRKEVVRTGRVLQGHGSLVHREFEMYTLSDYARLNEERAPILAKL